MAARRYAAQSIISKKYKLTNIYVCGEPQIWHMMHEYAHTMMWICTHLVTIVLTLHSTRTRHDGAHHARPSRDPPSPFLSAPSGSRSPSESTRYPSSACTRTEGVARCVIASQSQREVDLVVGAAATLPSCGGPRTVQPSPS